MPKVGDTVVVGSVTLNVTTDVVAAHTAAAATDKDQLVFTMTDLGISTGGDSGAYADISLSGLMNYATAYADTAGGAALRHFSTDFDDIDDASADNNSWGAESAGVAAPRFAGSTAIDPVFTVPDPSAPTASGTATQSLAYVANHPIDVEADFGAAVGTTSLSEVELLAAGFDYQDAVNASIVNGTTCDMTGTISGTTLTVTVNLAPVGCATITAAGEQFIAGQLSSDYELAQKANPANVTQQ